ncbi:MAG TPA: tRNA lysidine(34) synthetase TilS [Caulobacteraceae bacterium]
MKSLPQGEVFFELDARLERRVPAPIAVAFSGGGDSLALLLAAKAWTDDRGRRLIALTVDHGLQAPSAGWAAWCARRAHELGVEHRTLAWLGEKPRAGLAAAARGARHALIADAAREAGARVVLFGHTADDVLEAEGMRADGLSVPSPRGWSPSPAWPRGRDLYISRPLLGVRRAAIRAVLARAGETWIEDPANVDPRQPRARTRALIAAAGGSPRPQEPPADLSPLFLAASFGPAGDLALPLETLASASVERRRRFLGMAIACASGGEPPARGPFFDRLAGLTAGDGPFVSTVGGALTLANGATLRIVREIGDRRSRPAPELALIAGEPVVWDGRFEIDAEKDGLRVRPLAGLASRLSPAARKALSDLSSAARRALPAIIDAAGAVSSPALIPDQTVTLRGLVEARLAGACGVVQTEADAAAWSAR